jgi:hypothetical protein
MTELNLSFISWTTLLAALYFVFPVTCKISNQFNILALQKICYIKV